MSAILCRCELLVRRIWWSPVFDPRIEVLEFVRFGVIEKQKTNRMDDRGTTGVRVNLVVSGDSCHGDFYKWYFYILGYD
jgi:hypothetical protein